MNATQALWEARAAGVTFRIDGGSLLLEANAEPPQAMLDALSRHKMGILALLRPADDGWSAEDWQAFFDERAGIAEFDGGMSRADAEAHAFNCCVDEWLNRNPVRSAPGLCARCGGGDQADDPLVPVGTTCDAWLLTACRTGWDEARRSEAIAALARMKIRFPKIESV